MFKSLYPVAGSLVIVGLLTSPLHAQPVQLEKSGSHKIIQIKKKSVKKKKRKAAPASKKKKSKTAGRQKTKVKTEKNTQASGSIDMEILKEGYR